ncbi:MAG: hypothetical protein BRC28_04020 [Nanohaloarchaea archaeon SW_4_43_9]|nr:MAG: hypothetical protein BRC28_04020 [Nanohaloarchaea archaeon SW_4_43_9]
MEGQAQAITAVLITSVVVGTVATSYTWGVPLLEKQQNQAELERTEQNVLGLYNQIVEVSQGGEGTSAEIDLFESSNSDTRVRVNEKQNYIEIRKRGGNSPYPVDTWTLLKGNSLQNLSVGSGAYARSNDDLPGAVLVRSINAEEESLVTYRVEFRNMLADTPSGRELSRINLTAEGQTSSSGSTTIFVSNQGKAWERGSQAVELPNQEKVPRENTELVLGFR